MQICVSTTCPCTCVGSAKCLASLDVTESCSFFSPFPLEPNLQSSENLLETVTAACWLLPGSHTSSLPHLVLWEGCSPLSRLSCRSVSQKNPLGPRYSHGMGVQYKLRPGCSWFSVTTLGALGRRLLNPFVFLQHGTTTALTGCRLCRCPQKPTPQLPEVCHQRLTFSTEPHGSLHL